MLLRRKTQKAKAEPIPTGLSTQELATKPHATKPHCRMQLRSTPSTKALATNSHRATVASAGTKGMLQSRTLSTPVRLCCMRLCSKRLCERRATNLHAAV